MKRHVYEVNEGSRFAPLERGPVKVKGTVLDLSEAEVSIRLTRDGASVLAFDHEDAAGEGNSAGILSWTIAAGITGGCYMLWWRFERPDEEPCIIGPDELHVKDVPA